MAFFVGTLDLKLHVDPDVVVQLQRTCSVDGLAIYILSLHAVQAKHAETLDSTGVHLLEGKIPFPREATGSFVHDTKFIPSHALKLAVVSTVSPLPLSPAVELNGVHVDAVRPPPPIVRLEVSGGHVDVCLPPPPAVRVELNGVHVDDSLSLPPCM